MIDVIPVQDRAGRLCAAGLSASGLEAFLHALDRCAQNTSAAASLQDDAAALRLVYARARSLLAEMPLRSQRNPAQKGGGEALVHLAAAAARDFFRRHAVGLYADITDGGSRSLRVDDLLREAAARLPGILPTEAELAEESQLMQQDKDGMEIPQGLFISQVMSDRASGLHLVRAMLRPKAESLALLDEFVRNGRIDLGTIRVEVEGETAYVYIHNERYLNSEDDTTVGPMEMAVDLVLLHPGVRMGVLRGSVLDHPKYKGRRVFCSGINLTRIYQGKQSYISFLYRNLGLHSKIYRGILPQGLADSLEAPMDEPEETTEKLWVAVVEAFAIGGGCQLLLVVDYVIAEEGSYFNLPARKEGILPGAANMRLPRFVGERLAREAIMFDRTFRAETPEGRMIANQVVPRSEIDQAVRDCVANAVGSGMVSAGANRKAIRVQTEPMDQFRTYMATYARDQAFCHLSEQLVRNLERHWNAKERKL
ncbi:enoyl-CoA hydratase/isomerase family protein [Roseomonas chloroacetimidivorans]|jgi:thioesterase DpgC|uniref:enoyl-CoA hydratase/isomerase family protein n=1 Tax=Roseomonas chloroacetimidivorans TaxID=1766656 RepID=UPI003C76668E